MTLFLCFLIIYCALLFYLYSLAPSKHVRLILVVRNQQHRLEWLVRFHMFKARWSATNLQMTIVDAGSTDRTTQIAATLAHTYSLDFYVVENIAVAEHLLNNWRNHKFRSVECKFLYCTD
jgi:hypothetical protein